MMEDDGGGWFWRRMVLEDDGFVVFVHFLIFDWAGRFFLLFQKRGPG